VSLFQLKPDAKVLFKVADCQIVDYNIIPTDYGFIVDWAGDCGFGSFAYYKDETGEHLETECMGRRWCVEMLKQIFDRCKLDHEE
jgi:hypothetical protein